MGRARVSLNPRRGASPADLDALESHFSHLDSGEETVSRLLCSSIALGTGTGTMRISFFTARKSRQSTAIRVVTGSTPAAATPTLCRLGLYSVAPNGGLTLVASTPNDTTLFAVAGTAYTKAWSAPVEIAAGQRYAIGFLVVSAAATPTFTGAAAVAADSNLAPRTGASLGGQADLPATATDASLSGLGGVYYAVI